MTLVEVVPTMWLMLTIAISPKRTKKELALENKPCTYHFIGGRAKPRLRIGRCP
jgi:hypothetical protein